MGNYKLVSMVGSSQNMSTIYGGSARCDIYILTPRREQFFFSYARKSPKPIALYLVHDRGMYYVRMNNRDTRPDEVVRDI
jgi:hypothetical protein